MNWYREAKLADIDGRDDMITYRRCMMCQKYLDENNIWKSVEDMDEEEKEQVEELAKHTHHRSPIGASDGLCDKCHEIHLKEIEEYYAQQGRSVSGLV